ncbi:MAG: transferase [Pseudomonadota bacterium]
MPKFVNSPAGLQLFKQGLSKLKEKFDGTQGEPYIVESNKFKALYFDSESTQSLMDIQAPIRLVVSYTETMMGFLLFQDEPKKIAMIGLGGGSLAKYCHHYLPGVSIVVLENNPKVIALKDKFHVPENSAHFQVLEADGAAYFRDTEEKFDVLLVDGYTKLGQAAQLCSEDFYSSCLLCLKPDGVLVINFSGAAGLNQVYQERIDRVFDYPSVLVVEDDRMNQILFVSNGPSLNMPAEDLLRRSSTLSKAHEIHLARTTQNFLAQRNLDAG